MRLEDQEKTALGNGPVKIRRIQTGLLGMIGQRPGGMLAAGNKQANGTVHGGQQHHAKRKSPYCQSKPLQARVALRVHEGAVVLDDYIANLEAKYFYPARPLPGSITASSWRETSPFSE